MKISDNLFSFFYEAGSVATFMPGERIYTEEDDASSIYLITSGRVRVYSVTCDGREITYDVLERGHIFGESSFLQGNSRQVNVEAVNEAVLIRCKPESFYPYLMQSEELTLALFRHLNQTCDYVTSLLKRAYSYNRFEKVAAFLLEKTATDNPELNIISGVLPYSHEEIANSVGLSRVTVTKVLREFSRKGYIENRYRAIAVKDRPGLSSVFRY